MQVLSQRDPRWGNIPLGKSKSTTISSHGCTITCLAIMAGITPDEVNKKLLEVNGYAEKNLVIWGKIKEALPNMNVTKIGWTYDNADVLKNLPCLVEVDGTPIGAPRHWVVYIGNKKMLDPWTGKEENTSKYTPLSYRVIEGKYKQEQEEDPCKKIKEELVEMRKSRDEHKKMRAVQDKVIETLKEDIRNLHKKLEEKKDEVTMPIGKTEGPEVKSNRFTLTITDKNKIIKGAAIAAGSALITYMLEALPGIDFGENTAMTVAVISVVLNAFRKLLTNTK